MPGRRPSHTRATVIAVAAVVLLALLGAVVGASVGSGRAVPVTASTLLALQPDPGVSGNPEQVLENDVDVSESFLQTQLVSLESTQFLADVEEVTGQDADLSATRVNQSNVVELAATAPDAAAAVAVADGAAQLYGERRAAAAQQRLGQQSTTVQQQLATVEAQLDSSPGGDVLPAEEDRLLALQGRYESLLTLDSSLQLALPSVGQGSTVLQPAVVEPVDGASTGLLYGALGALVGALVGLAGVVVWRRTSSRLRSERDLDDVEGVLSPVTPDAGGRWRQQLGSTPSAVSRAVSLQSGQLRAHRTGERSALVLVGSSSGVGTSFLAVQHAVSLARRSPTLLVCGGDTVSEGLAPGGSAELLGVDATRGGLAALAGTGPVDAAAVRAAAQPTSVPGLDVLTGGRDGGAALEAVAGRGLLAAARNAGYEVVVDAPPLDVSLVGQELGADADAVGVVAGLGVSPRAEVESALVGLSAPGRAVVGVLVNTLSRQARGHRSSGTGTGTGTDARTGSAEQDDRQSSGSAQDLLPQERADVDGRPDDQPVPTGETRTR